MEDLTDGKSRSYTMSGTKLTVIIVTAVVVALAILYGIVALTPLRTTIPGYPDGRFRKEAVANAIKIDSLENAIVRWQLYVDNLSRVLSGDETLVLDSLMKGHTQEYLSNKSAAEISKQDSALRKLVAKEEQFGLRGNDKQTQSLEGAHFFTPLKGVVSKGFDKSLHPGINISAPANSVVSATLDGTVVFAGWDDQMGNTLVIQHRGDIISIYQHNESLLCKTGERVKAGAPVALVGNSGVSTTENGLHFAIWYKGEPVDPQKYIKF